MTDSIKRSSLNTKQNIPLATPDRYSEPTGKAGELPVNSCLSSPGNPKTMKRKQMGKIPVVVFDERVVVHTVPHWDPSRTQSFSDTSPPTNEQTCNCCTIV